MVQLLIKVDDRKVRFMLSGYTRTIPKAAGKGARKLASFAARTYLNQAKAAGIKSWRGKLFGKFRGERDRPTRLGPREYGVSIAGLRGGTGKNYAISLDRMPAHFVALRRGRLITQWAKQKLGKPVPKKLRVRPHPYINQSNRIIGRNIKKIMGNEVHKAITRKGR